MNRSIAGALAGAVLFAATPFLLSQSAGSPPPAESRTDGRQMSESLEDLLATALRSNPDILLAEAKLRESQAQLNQVRLRVTQEVAGLFQEKKTAALARETATAQLEEARKLHERNLVSRSKVNEAVLGQADAEANLAKVDAQLRYALGVGGSEPDPPSTSRAKKTTLRTPRPEVPPRFSAALETEIAGSWEGAPLRQILDSLQEMSGIPFVYSSDVVEILTERETTVRLGKTYVADLLLALTDIHQGEFCFVIRDYGVLVVDREVAERIDGATIPASVPLLRE